VLSNAYLKFYGTSESGVNGTMAEKDYYKILGLEKNASANDIKKAYRKLAMKYHPDHAAGDKASEDKFKQISEAYAVLSDPQKRKEYDEYGASGFQQRFSQEDIFRNFDFGDIFREFGFNAGGTSTGDGGVRFSFGGGPFGSSFGGRRQQAAVKGSDLMYEMPLTLYEVANGTTKSISLQHQGRADTITVKIPRGMISGKKLRLSGKGEPSAYGGPAGDLFIVANVVPDPVFSVDNQDLIVNREIKLSDALLGTQISVPTLEGKEMSLKVPPGVRHKTKMRLAGQGLPRMKSAERGDLYVVILIEMPRNLTSEQETLVRKLADTGL
jgi:curved DNA-binding protein